MSNCCTFSVNTVCDVAEDSWLRYFLAVFVFITACVYYTQSTAYCIVLTNAYHFNYLKCNKNHALCVQGQITSTTMCWCCIWLGVSAWFALYAFPPQYNGARQSREADRWRVPCCVIPTCHRGVHHRPLQLCRRRQRGSFQHLHTGPAALLHGDAPVPACSHQKRRLSSGTGCRCCLQSFHGTSVYGWEVCLNIFISVMTSLLS